MKNYYICINNESYEVSLELKKLYTSAEKGLSDPEGFLRIIDESGEDYLYPADYFFQVNIPQNLEEKLFELEYT